MFGCNNEVAGIQRPRIARFHCSRIIAFGRSKRTCFAKLTSVLVVNDYKYRTSVALGKKYHYSAVIKAESLALLY